MACATSTHPYSDRLLEEIIAENRNRNRNGPDNRCADDMETSVNLSQVSSDHRENQNENQNQKTLNSDSGVSISEAKKLEELDVSLEELLQEFRGEGKEDELVFQCEICQEFLTFPQLSTHSSKHKNSASSLEKKGPEPEPESESSPSPDPQQISRSRSIQSPNSNSNSTPTSVITSTSTGNVTGTGGTLTMESGLEIRATSISTSTISDRPTSVDSNDSGVSLNSSVLNSPHSQSHSGQYHHHHHYFPSMSKTTTVSNSKCDLPVLDQKQSNEQFQFQYQNQNQNQHHSQIQAQSCGKKSNNCNSESSKFNSHLHFQKKPNSTGGFLTSYNYCNHPYSQIEPPLPNFSFTSRSSPVPVPVPVAASPQPQAHRSHSQNGNLSYIEDKRTTQNAHHSGHSNYMSHYGNARNKDIPLLNHNYLNFQHPPNQKLQPQNLKIQTLDRAHTQVQDARDPHHPRYHPYHRYNTRSSRCETQTQNHYPSSSSSSSTSSLSSSPHNSQSHPPPPLQHQNQQQRPNNPTYPWWSHGNYGPLNPCTYVQNPNPAKSVPRFMFNNIECYAQNVLSMHKAHKIEQARLKDEYEKQLRRRQEQKENEKRKLEESVHLWDALQKISATMCKTKNDLEKSASSTNNNSHPRSRSPQTPIPNLIPIRAPTPSPMIYAPVDKQTDIHRPSSSSSSESSSSCSSPAVTINPIVTLELKKNPRESSSKSKSQTPSTVTINPIVTLELKNVPGESSSSSSSPAPAGVGVRFQCNYCPNYFNKGMEVIEHELGFHKVSKLWKFCHQCGKRYKSVNGLHAHIEKCHARPNPNIEG